MMKHIKIPEQPVSNSQNTPLSRDTVLIGIFGALWGLMEITLGVFLKGLRIPMGGALLTALSSVIFLTGRYFIRRPGSILMMGGIAAVLKVFSVGTVIAGPFMAIIIEALLAEIWVSILGINRFSFIITPVILTLYTIIHPFIAQGLIFGDNIYQVYVDMFQKIASFPQIQAHSLLWIVMIYVFLHILLGLISGWFTFLLCKQVETDYKNL